MHYVKVTVSRDETASMVLHVGAWEAPILEAKHGEERLAIGELKEFKTREWPTDARSEMQRLNQLYGRTGSGDNAPTFAETVYGQGSVGVKALGAAMAQARKDAEGPAKRPAKRAVGRPRKGDTGKPSDLVGAATG